MSKNLGCDALICPDCGGDRIFEDGGEMVCQKCGSVLDEMVVDDEMGNAPLTPEQSQRSVMSQGHIAKKPGSDFGGRINNLSPQEMDQYRRMEQWQRMSRLDARGRRALGAFDEMKDICGELGVSKDVENEAKHYYQEAQRSNLVRGRPKKTAIAACIYCSCRAKGVGIPIDKIASACDVEKKSAARLSLELTHSLGLPTKPNPALVYVRQYGETLDLEMKVIFRAQNILQTIYKIESKEGINILRHLKPEASAAAALYIASKEPGGVPVSQAKMAKTARISNVTLREHRDLIHQARDQYDIY